MVQDLRYSISSGEARSWYVAVKDNGDRLLEEKITTLGKSLKQHYNAEEWGDGTLLPPDEYKTAEVTISDTEQVQLKQALENLRSFNAESYSIAEPQLNSIEEDSAELGGNLYSISSGEARSWYAVVKDRGDRLLEERITALGKSLKQYYNAEEWGDGTWLPPDEYKTAEVTITENEQTQMQRAIAPLHSSLPMQSENKVQMERD